jgi:hypothetical protein
MGIFIKTQKLMNVHANLYWQHTEVAYLDGHGYVTNYMVLNGADSAGAVVRRCYQGYRFDDTNPAVTTFTQPTSVGRKRAVASTDGVDVMTTGGETSAGGNQSTVEQFRASSSTSVSKTSSPVLTSGRELGVGTASWKNSHFHIGGQRATNNPQTNIDAIHYAANATTVSQGNLSVAGKNPCGCGNGTAAIYRNQDSAHQTMEVINISDHTAGAGTHFISQMKSPSSLLAIEDFGSAVSTGPDAVFIAGTIITAIPWDDSAVETTWAASLSANHNRGAAVTDGETIVITAGLNGASNDIRYFQANSMSTTVTSSTQTIPLSIKQHTSIGYQ